MIVIFIHLSEKFMYLEIDKENDTLEDLMSAADCLKMKDIKIDVSELKVLVKTVYDDNIIDYILDKYTVPWDSQRKENAQLFKRYRIIRISRFFKYKMQRVTYIQKLQMEYWEDCRSQGLRLYKNVGKPDVQAVITAMFDGTILR